MNAERLTATTGQPSTWSLAARHRARAVRHGNRRGGTRRGAARYRPTSGGTAFLPRAPPAHLPWAGGLGPGQRRAPAFTLHDQNGHAVSLAAQHGQPVLIAFLDTARDDRSGPLAISLAQAEALLPQSERPVLDVINLDPGGDTLVGIRAAAARLHLRGPYHWLVGPSAAIKRVLHDYGVDQSASVTATHQAGAPLYLIDRAGFESAGYLYPFFPTVLAVNLKRLYRERG